MSPSEKEDDASQIIYSKADGTPTKTSTSSSSTFIKSTCPHYAESSVSKFTAMLYGATSTGMGNDQQQCVECGSSHEWLLQCLQCGLFGCANIHVQSGDFHHSVGSMPDSMGTIFSCHLRTHIESTGHTPLLLDINSGMLICLACNGKLIWNHHLQNRWLYGPDAAFFPSKRALSEHNPAWRAHCIALRGLHNLGHTCFMNAVLQVLLHVPVMRNFFLELRHPQCNSSGCVASELAKLFADMYSGETLPMAPTNFLNELWKARSIVAGYAQQDAHEFFIAAMDASHECLLKDMGKRETIVSNEGKGSKGKGEDTEMVEFQIKNEQDTEKEHQICKCEVHQIFGGLLRSEVKCLKCSRVTTRSDPFTNLSLDMADSVTINGCLERYCRVEKLPGKDYKCAGCGTAQIATKRLSVQRLPNCLVLHLKRFEQTTPVMTGIPSKLTTTGKQQAPLQKIDRHLHFSTELPITTLKPSSDEHENYKLMGVVVHMGSLDAGHYIAYVTHRDSWFKMDDAMVTKVDGAEVLSSHAYMLFYTLDK